MITLIKNLFLKKKELKEAEKKERSPMYLPRLYLGRLCQNVNRPIMHSRVNNIIIIILAVLKEEKTVALESLHK